MLVNQVFGEGPESGTSSIREIRHRAPLTGYS
jgi:hypothetical protein